MPETTARLHAANARKHVGKNVPARLSTVGNYRLDEAKAEPSHNDESLVRMESAVEQTLQHGGNVNAATRDELPSDSPSAIRARGTGRGESQASLQHSEVAAIHSLQPSI